MRSWPALRRVTDVTRIEIELLDETTALTLGQVCRICSVHAEFVCDLVDEGIVTPQGKELRTWRFGGDAVVRIRKAVRLQRDLGVNLPGIALAFDLLSRLQEAERTR